MDWPNEGLSPLSTVQWLRQQGSSSVVISTGNMDQTLTELFKFDEGYKPNIANYCDYISKAFLGIKCIFMSDNVPSHVSKVTVYLSNANFTKDNIMEWQPSFSDDHYNIGALSVSMDPI